MAKTTAFNFRGWAVVLVLLFGASELFSQAAPSGWTTYYRFRKYAAGVNPSADSLNQNWIDIDKYIRAPGRVRLDSVMALGTSIKMGADSSTWAMFYRDSVVVYSGNLRKFKIDSTGIYLFDAENAIDTVATRDWARAQVAAQSTFDTIYVNYLVQIGEEGAEGILKLRDGGGTNFSSIYAEQNTGNSIIYIPKQVTEGGDTLATKVYARSVSGGGSANTDTVHTYQIRVMGSDTVYIDRSSTSLRFAKYLNGYYKSWFVGSFGFAAMEESDTWDNATLKSFIWKSEASIYVECNYYVYLPASNWPIGDFGRVGLYMQIKQKGGDWQPLGQYYVQNQTVNIIDSAVTNFRLGVGWPTYTDTLFTPGDFGYSVNDTVQVRLKLENHLGAIGGWINAFWAKDSTWWQAGAVSTEAVYMDGSTLTADKIVVADSIAAGDAAALFGSVSARTLEGTSGVRVGSVSDTTVGYIDFVTSTRNIVRLFAVGNIAHKFAFPAALDTVQTDSIATQRYVLAQISAPAAVRSYITSPADKPPYSADTFDDEFNTNTLDTTGVAPGGWSWTNRISSSTAVASHGFCIMIDTGKASGNAWRILTKNVGDSAWTITTKVYGSLTGNWSNAGLVIYNTTSGRLYTFGPVTNSNTNSWLQLNRYTNTSTYASTSYQTVNPYPMPYWYLRFGKTASGGTVYAEISGDGFLYSRIWSEAVGTYIENSGTINKIGIGVIGGANTIIGQASFPWVRFNWTADWDPTVDH